MTVVEFFASWPLYVKDMTVVTVLVGLSWWWIVEADRRARRGESVWIVRFWRRIRVRQGDPVTWDNYGCVCDDEAYVCLCNVDGPGATDSGTVEVNTQMEGRP